MITRQQAKKLNFHTKSQKDTNVISDVHSFRYFTRSRASMFENNYDFNLSSKEWNKNKKKHKNGVYSYINY